MVAGVKIAEVADDEFNDIVIASGKPAVVDFSAKWCVPCRDLEVILQEMASEYDGKVSFYKVDVNESGRTASKYSVRSIPTLLFISKGEVFDQVVGSVTRDTLSKKLRMLAESA